MCRIQRASRTASFAALVALALPSVTAALAPSRSATGTLAASPQVPSSSPPPAPPPQSPPSASAPPAPPSASPGPVPQAAPAPPARAADVASLEAIIAAVYDTISGPAGAPRDWDRFRSLFVPGARLIPISRRPDAPAEARVRTVEDYVAGASRSFAQSGFFEREVTRTVERYGGLAHVFSTYEARRAADEATPFMRGINSFQLLFDGTRWWVVTIYWQAETPDTPLPQKYLPAK